ncbi:MAG: hypothetical protein JWP38_1784 [Herbaspirillum sp.]|nr:hypothetical protein [Herbaspirillum sp.]
MMSAIKTNFTDWRRPLIAMLVTMICTVAIMTTFVTGPLQGEFRHFFLPAKMFGVPQQLRDHGIDEMYLDDINSGWDGQFYFYIANDPLALRDTVQHVDSNAYRYQRIGLPLLANLVSKITFQSWVSPLTYYLTSLCILLLSTLMAAAYFQRRSISPYWILFWALGMGTQVTQLHGLPDVAADGLLIIGLVCWMRGWRIPYVLSIAFAGLSREIYVLVPAFIFIGQFWLDTRETGLKFALSPRQVISFCKRMWIHFIPMLAVIAWQIFIRLKFHVSPSSQATNVLDWPFSSSFHFMLAPFTGERPMDRHARMESFGILLFLILLGTATFVFTRFIRRHLTQPKQQSAETAVAFGVGLAFLVVVAMYICFGSTVMMDHSGYWKAANIFLFALPFAAAVEGRSPGKWVWVMFSVATIFFSIFLLGRITAPPYFYNGKIEYATSEPACMKQFQASILPQSIEVNPKNFWRSLRGPDTATINIEIRNLGSDSFKPYRGKGAVSMSYQWVRSSDGTVVKDGIRTELTSALAPNQAVQLPVFVQFPNTVGDYVLKLSLVQEGCTWFYLANPASGFDIHYKIR